MAYSRADLLPWGWTITPADPSTKCPSPTAILVTLAIVNAAVSTLSVLFGNRRVLNWLTCRHWFTEPNSKWWRVTWLVNVALQLGANALIAFIFQRTPGYNANFEIWQVMLFFTVRPRLSWIAMGVLGPYSVKQGKQISVPRRRRGQGRYASVPNVQEDTKEVWMPEFPWRSSAIAQIFSEMVLQCCALYIMGMTVHFATQQGYYSVTSDSYAALPHAAHMMYAGALFYVIVGSGMLLWEFIWIIRIAYNGSVTDGVQASGLGLFVIFNLFTTWLGSWIFWAGFVNLAGNLYCPPKLYAQGSIWGIFSLFGIIVGGGGA